MSERSYRVTSNVSALMAKLGRSLNVSLNTWRETITSTDVYFVPVMEELACAASHLDEKTKNRNRLRNSATDSA